MVGHSMPAHPASTSAPATSCGAGSATQAVPTGKVAADDTAGGGDIDGATMGALVEDLSETVDELMQVLQSASRAPRAESAAGCGAMAAPTAASPATARGASPAAPLRVPPSVAAARGGGPTTNFDVADATRMIVNLDTRPGATVALDNVERLIGAREQRIAMLDAALARDAGGGLADPVNLQRLSLERGTTDQLRSLVSHLRAVVGSMSPQDSAAVLDLAQQANTTGSIDPTALMRLSLRVESQAAGLPATFVAAGERAVTLFGSHMARLNAASQEASEEMNLRGVVNPVAVQHVASVAAELQAFSVALRGVVDLARTDPAGATARIDTALASAAGGLPAATAHLTAQA